MAERVPGDTGDAAFVRLNQSVAETDDPFGVRGDVVLVRHHDDRASLVVQPGEQLHDLQGRFRVQVAGGFIRQNEIRIVDQAAGDGHALLLAAGQLRRPVPQPLAQADHRGQGVAAFFGLPVDAALVVQRHLDVLDDRQLRNQVVRLEHEADPAGANPRQFAIVHLGHVVVAQEVRAGRGLVQATQEIQQRALPRAGRAHDGDVIALGHFQRNAAQGAHRFAFEHIVLGQVLQAARQSHEAPPGDAGRGPGWSPGGRTLGFSSPSGGGGCGGRILAATGFSSSTSGSVNLSGKPRGFITTISPSSEAGLDRHEGIVARPHLDFARLEAFALLHQAKVMPLGLAKGLNGNLPGFGQTLDENADLGVHARCGSPAGDRRFR